MAPKQATHRGAGASSSGEVPPDGRPGGDDRGEPVQESFADKTRRHCRKEIAIIALSLEAIARVDEELCNFMLGCHRDGKPNFDGFSG